MFGIDAQGREAIQKHLRAADEFFRVKNYDMAITSVEQALAIDPRSPLARTFLERVKAAQKMDRGGPAPAPAEDKSKLIPQIFRDVDLFISRKEYDRALQKVREVLTIDPGNMYAKVYLDNIDKLKKQPAAPAPAPAAAATAPAAPVQRIERGGTAMYKELLKEFWFDGTITAEEEEQLRSVREIFSITPEEHRDVEKEVKMSAYVTALQIAWKDGVVTQNEQTMLHSMRQRYSISEEEHRSLEAKIEVAKRTKKSRGTVLLVDGDMESLSRLLGELKKWNYDALIAHSMEDAFAQISRTMPDVIISEILFDGSPNHGFAFFKRLQEQPNTKRVPFFFMTAHDDDKIDRAGIRIGVKQIFRKPLDLKFIIASVDSAISRA